MNGFPTKDKKEAKFILLQSELWADGFIHELNLRHKLEKEWAEKHSVKYDSRKAAFEYTIKMLNIVFKYLPDNLITKYTQYMNGWYFDKNKMSIESMSFIKSNCPFIFFLMPRDY